MAETVALREIEVRIKGRPRRVQTPITSPVNVADFVRRLVGGDTREHLVAIYLDNRHAPIGYRVVSVGTVSGTLVHPREVFGPALALSATAVVIAHNHPSGNPEPSAEDRTVTNRLTAAGELLGIVLVDHVVVGYPGYVSIRELGEPG